MNFKKIPLLWLAPFISFSLGYQLSSFLLEPKLCQVPSLVGKSLSSALQVASQNSLTLELHQMREFAGVPSGTILDQLPAAGRMLRPYQAVAVTITKTPPVLNMPKLLGFVGRKNIAEVLPEETVLSMVFVTSCEPQGTVIGQYPPPGEPFTENFCTVFCSDGPSSVYVMPNLTQRSVADAKKRLASYGAQVQVVDLSGMGQVASRTGLVVDQKPMHGSIIDLSKGLSVQLGIKNI